MSPEARRVLITGSNRGLGRAIAEAFLGRGDRVASLNRTLDGDVRLGEVACDLAAPEGVPAAVREATTRLGALDVCVLNAAVRRLAPVEGMSDEDWDASVATNLTSAFRVAREAIPALVASGGQFVVIGSHATRHPFESGAAYCSTKAAVEAFARVLALELRPQGIRVTLISPGAIRNRPMGEADAHKIEPASLAQLIVQCVEAPADLIVGELDVRPAQPVASPLTGIARLQPC
ncbi:MAG: SDR family NAD(P)-dependent oxidoreductase [Dehalococcoidia bacterium]|nr:SDR family NAD(P)-dependent oxidoreductase [Dehalococcoidia bacterium]